MGERHTRRQFVRRGSAAALVFASTPALLTASAAAAPTTAELRRRLRGTLVTPRDAGWDAARALYNPRLDVAPRAIAFCESTRDVAQVVRFARARAGRGGDRRLAGHVAQRARDALLRAPARAAAARRRAHADRLGALVRHRVQAACAAGAARRRRAGPSDGAQAHVRPGRAARRRAAARGRARPRRSAALSQLPALGLLQRAARARSDRRARRPDRALAGRRRQRPRGRRAARRPRRRRQPREAERDGVRPPAPAHALRVPELLGRERPAADRRRLRAVDARDPRGDAPVRVRVRVPELHRSRARRLGAGVLRVQRGGRFGFAQG